MALSPFGAFAHAAGPLVRDPLVADVVALARPVGVEVVGAVGLAGIEKRLKTKLDELKNQHTSVDLALNLPLYLGPASSEPAPPPERVSSPFPGVGRKDPCRLAETSASSRTVFR